jgi:hypothetical protein
VATCRLVVGADGRDSGVRRRAGIVLHAVEPRLLGAGLLVEDLSEWPSHELTIGTEGDVVFFVLPQGAGRARLYLMYSVDQGRRFTGPTAARAFLDTFSLACMPESECIVRAKPAGPWLLEVAPASTAATGRARRSGAPFRIRQEADDGFRSLNEPICLQQHRPGDRQPERPGGLEIDDQLELRRLLHRQVSRLRALEDPVDQARRPAPELVL